MRTPYTTELVFRVLLYKENQEWTAHALELDLLGFGESEEEAFEDLRQAVSTQISFATQIGDTSLIDHKAPKEFFERWNDAQERRLEGLISCREEDKCLTVRATLLQFKPTETARIVERARRNVTFRSVLVNA